MEIPTPRTLEKLKKEAAKKHEAIKIRKRCYCTVCKGEVLLLPRQIKYHKNRDLRSAVRSNHSSSLRSRLSRGRRRRSGLSRTPSRASEHPSYANDSLIRASNAQASPSGSGLREDFGAAWASPSNSPRSHSHPSSEPRSPPFSPSEGQSMQPNSRAGGEDEFHDLDDVLGGGAGRSGHEDDWNPYWDDDDDLGSWMDQILGREPQDNLDHQEGPIGHEQGYESDPEPGLGDREAQPSDLRTAPPSDEDDEDEVGGDYAFPGEAIPAMSADPSIRNVYVAAYVNAVFYGATLEQTRLFLRTNQQSMLSVAERSQEHNNQLIYEIKTMSISFKSVERQLGLHLDDLITTYALCPACGKRFTLQEIEDAHDSYCPQANCRGQLFLEKILARGKRRRRPCLTFPTASPTEFIRQTLLRPGIPEAMQHWRREELGDFEDSLPVSREEWEEMTDMDTVLEDVSDGWLWRSQPLGLKRTVNIINYEVRDVVTRPGMVTRFTSAPFALQLSLNFDGFQTSKDGKYSVSACYLTINNLPPHLRLRRENMPLVLLTPGPKAPNDYTLNEIIDPLVDELIELQKGVEMLVYNSRTGEIVRQMCYAQLMLNLSDAIARFKICGGHGLTHHVHFCLYCRSKMFYLALPKGFIRRDFQMRDPHEQLRIKQFWQSMQTPGDREDVWERLGTKFFPFDRMPGWHAALASPVDAMHNIFLGMTAWIVSRMIVGPGLLDYRHPQDPSRRSPVQRWNDCVKSAWFPARYTRLPPLLGSTLGGLKADQWNLTGSVLMVILFEALRVGDEIPNWNVPSGSSDSLARKHDLTSARQNLKRKKAACAESGLPPPVLDDCFPSRNARDHFYQVLDFCWFKRMIVTQKVTRRHSHFCMDLLEDLCVRWADMNVNMSPNFHYCTHLGEDIEKAGSVTNTWVFGFERANGVISKMNTNGHGAGELEGTYMRSYSRYPKIIELIRVLQELPDRSSHDNETIEMLLRAVKKGPEHARQRGTLDAYLAGQESQKGHSSLQLGSHSQPLHLLKSGLNVVILKFCSSIWPDLSLYTSGVVNDGTFIPPAGFSWTYSHAFYEGVRYSAWTHHRGKGSCYAYIEGRQAVRIDHIVEVTIPDMPECKAVCALVRRFIAPDIFPQFPWAHLADQLGIDNWAYDQLSDTLEAVDFSAFTGVFALFSIFLSYGDYWVTVSLDSVQCEPEREGGL